MLLENIQRKEVTPQRVLALLKLINKFNGKIKRKDIETYIELDSNEGSLAKVIKFCESEKFIFCDHDYNYTLMIDSKYINSMKNFKKFISEKIFSEMKIESLFFKVTKEILAKDLDFYEFTSFETISNQITEENANKEFVLFWRFWAEFIGIGKIIDEYMLINPYDRIYDLVFNDFRNDNMKASEFVEILHEKCPEFKDCVKDNKMSLSLSLALRTLDEIGKIKLLLVKDAINTYDLYESDVYINKISDIKIIGD